MIIQTTIKNKKALNRLKSVKTQSCRAWLLFSFAALPQLAWSDEYDTLQFYGDVSEMNDNNLFRSDQRKTSDQITTAIAGVKVDKKYSLQHFYLDVSYNDYRYQKNSYLSYSAVNYKGGIDWTLTPSLTGKFLSSRSQTLAGFANYNQALQNIQTNKTDQFRAEYSPHDIWALIGGLTYTSLRNSQVFTAQNDYNYKGLDYGARYKLPSGTMFTLLGHHRLGSYLNRPLNPTFLYDNGFTEDEYELDMLFQVTGKSNLSAKAAYVARDQNHYTARNYADYQGFINYDWLVTGQIKTSLSLSRTVGYFLTAYSTYSVTDAASANVNYYFSDKLMFSANGKVDQRNFKVPAFSGIPLRQDNENSFGLNATWQPIKNIGVTLSAVQSKRGTTEAYSYYNYHDFTTSVTLDIRM